MKHRTKLLILFLMSVFGVACASAPHRGSSDEGLTKDEIQNTVASNTPDVRRCYEYLSKKDSMPEGEVVVDFTIGAQGEVVSSSIKKSDIDNAALKTCMLEKIKTWRFPAPKGAVQVKVSYPFRFKEAK